MYLPSVTLGKVSLPMIGWKAMPRIDDVASIQPHILYHSGDHSHTRRCHNKHKHAHLYMHLTHTQPHTALSSLSSLALTH
jgi:hypothetical protein